MAYCGDGTGRSSGVPQLSSQSATSRRGMVCPAATWNRASAIARHRTSPSVDLKVSSIPVMPSPLSDIYSEGSVGERYLMHYFLLEKNVKNER